MNEYLLKAIIRLFAIVAKGSVNDECRERVKFIVSRQANRERVAEYLKIFDDYTREEAGGVSSSGMSHRADMDPKTEEFVEEWASIMLICKRINLESSLFQKIVVILRVIELSHVCGEFNERQRNLIFYISQTLHIDRKVVNSVKQFVVGNSIGELLNEDVLIVDSGNRANYANSKHIIRPNLYGYMVVLYLPEIENYIIRYVGNVSYFLNGAALKSGYNYVFPSGSNIRGSKLRPIYYSNVVSQFKVAQDVNNIRLTADDIWIRFKQGRIGLRNINVDETSGKLIGIMGASGSGKSTLLETLIGKIKPKHGEVIINGINIHEEPERLEGLIGYVPQDDLLMEDLTVYQNLYYAAKLSFAKYRDKELHELVENTLHTLGIYETKDLIVGNPLNKTISGGQRKRLNIALELLREPSILFLDEPTSGLSSRDSENILDLLKELSLKGKLVFMTIHQPSSDIFKMFDNLLILDVGGFQIYYGDPVEAIVYFRDVVNMIQRDQGSCVTCGNVSVEQIFSIIETRVVNEYGKYTDQRRMSPKEWGDHFRKHKRAKKENKEAPLPDTLYKIPPRFDQFKVFCKRDVLSKFNNTQYLIVNFAVAPLLGLIIGYFIRYYDPSNDNTLGYTFANNDNIPYYFLMSIIVALFVGLSVSGEEIIKDRRILQREEFLNLSRSSYISSKVIILFGISAIQTLSFVFVGNLLLEFEGMFFTYWLVLFSCACFANLVGLNISSGLNSVIAIYIMIPIILIPQLMFNGVAIDFDRLNPKISSSEKVPMLGELMASRWAFEAIMVRQFRDNEYEKHFYKFDKVIADADYKMSFYLKELETNLAECNAVLRNDAPKASIKNQLALINHELKNELKRFDRESLIDWDALVPQKFDSAMYNKVEEQIYTLKNLYALRKTKTINLKDSLLKNEITDKHLEKVLLEYRNSYTNQKVRSMVKNIGLVSILEVGDKLIRKTTPIYTTPKVPQNPWNFRTFYYAPEKYFGGRYFDTYWFNVGIIWVMVIVTLIALYFDVLKRLLNLFVRIGDYQLRKKIEKGKLLFRR